MPTIYLEQLDYFKEPLNNAQLKVKMIKSINNLLSSWILGYAQMSCKEEEVSPNIAYIIGCKCLLSLQSVGDEWLSLS